VTDRSNGYESRAHEFMVQRRPHIGVATVRDWARNLPSGGSVLDLGCGHGVPNAQLLLALGLLVHGVDASPTLAAAFEERFP
jgi:methylase of polypeptide subunit release factors